MDISKKLSIFSITIAVISVIVSFVFIPRVNIKAEPQTGDDITSILNENQAQVELDIKKEELLKNLNRESQSKSYIDFCNTAEDVNDAVRAKKEELKKYAQEILDKAAVCRDDIEKTYNSEGITIANRLEVLKNYENSEVMKALNEVVSKADQTKAAIDSDIKAFKEAEAQRKAAQQQKSSSSNSSGSSGGSRSSNNYSSVGNSSSSSNSSSGGSSSSGSSSSSGDDWGGSER